MLKLLLLSFFALVVPVASQCNLCSNGNTNPTLPTDPLLKKACQDVIALLQTVQPGGCSGTQQGPYPKVCGCNGAYTFPCKVCPNGGTPNPFGSNNVATCNQIKLAAAFSLTTAQCTANLKPYSDRTNITVVCGCPGVPRPCALCPDGSSVGNPSRKLGVTSTCGTYDAFLQSTYNVGSPACNNIRASGLASACGCPGSYPKSCSICNGGATRGTPRVPNIVSYCQNLDYIALYTPTSSCFGNTNIYDQWACGCPSAVPTCKLCETNGGSFSLTKASDFTTIGGTCALDQFALKNLVELDCVAAQGTVGKVCGCSNPTSAAAACRICTDRPLPNPNLYVPSFGHTCSFIEYFASAEANSGAKSCTFFRGEYVNVCCEGGPDPYPTRPTRSPTRRAPTRFPTRRPPTKFPTRRPTTRPPTIRRIPTKTPTRRPTFPPF